MVPILKSGIICHTVFTSPASCRVAFAFAILAIVLTSFLGRAMARRRQTADLNFSRLYIGRGCDPSTVLLKASSVWRI
jgi:hypothetical protein